MIALGVAEVADRICVEPGGWSVVAIEEGDLDTVTAELTEELGLLLEEDGAGRLRVLAPSDAGPALVEELAQMAPDDVAILPLPVSAVAPVARALDYSRGRLVGHGRGLILTTAAAVPVLAAEAPNLWSWIGPRVWKIDPLAGHLDPEVRLASLREGTGLTDEEVIARAEAGTLPPDPIFAEWLVLLGKGELLG